MSEFAGLGVLLFAGEMLAMSALVMAIAWLASFRATASRRHLVWTAAFGALVALPVLAALVPGNVVIAWPAPDAAIPQDAVLSAAVLTAPAAAPATPQGFPFSVADAALVLLAAWIFGVALIALRSLIAAFVLRRMRADSAEHPFDESELPELANGRRYDLRVSHGERGPLTWGIFRPVVLLPNKAQFWPQERLEAVLLHELAHVCRRDSLTQMLALAACALYWPNPLVWWAARSMRREAEMAADDAALVTGLAPSAYAEELLHVAAEFRAAAMSLSMAAPSSLEARVKSVLAPKQQRSGVTSMDVLKISGIALLATTALVLARPSFAQDAPAAPPTPSSMATVATPPAPPAPATDVEAPTPPAPPTPTSDSVDANTPVHHFHTREVRRYTSRDGRHHVEVVERDGDSDAAMAQIQPEIDHAQIDQAMAQVKMDKVVIRAMHDAHIQAQIDAVGPQVQQALAEARAELAKVSDEKLRAHIDAALARAQEKMAAAQARMQAHMSDHRMVIRSDDDQSVDDEQDKDQDAPEGK